MAEDSKIHHLGWFLAGLGVGAVVVFSTLPKAAAKHAGPRQGAREGTEYVKKTAQQASEQVGVFRRQEQGARGQNRRQEQRTREQSRRHEQRTCQQPRRQEQDLVDKSKTRSVNTLTAAVKSSIAAVRNGKIRRARQGPGHRSVHSCQRCC